MTICACYFKFVIVTVMHITGGGIMLRCGWKKILVVVLGLVTLMLYHNAHHMVSATRITHLPVT